MVIGLAIGDLYSDGKGVIVMGRLKGGRNPATWAFIESSDAMDRIVEHVMGGHGLMDFCMKHELKRASVRKWIYEDQERIKLYEDARIMAADAYVDMATKVLEDCERDEEGQLTGPGVNLAKYRSDNYKWLAARLDPRTYGDRVSVDTTTTVTVDIRGLLDKRMEKLVTGERVVDSLPGVVIEGELVQ